MTEHASPEYTRYDTDFPRPRVHGINKAKAMYAASLAVVWIFCIAAAAIWVYGRGVQTLFTSFPRFLQNVGGLAGVVAAVLMMFQVLFMSRFPLFEYGFGRDIIVRVHKKVGYWSFWMILAHAALLVGGYNIAADFNPWAGWTGTGTLLATLIFAIVGVLAIFIAVIFLSLKKIKSKISYDVWYWWHMVSWVGALITVPHQIFLGASFRTEVPVGYFLGYPVTRLAIFWMIMWVIVFGAAAVWRFIVPVANYFKYGMRVVEVKPDGARGIDVIVTGKHLDRLGTKAGQFFNWRFLGSKGAIRSNWFSVSMPPTSDRLRICVRVVGDGTQRMAKLKPGQRVFVEGPYGRISGDLRTGHRMLMFAGGAGAGPMVSLLTDQDWAPGEATLISRENAHEDTMMVEDIERLVNDRGLVWIKSIGLPNIPAFPDNYSGGSSWLPANEDGTPVDGVSILREWVAGEVDNVDVFLCGPPIWMDSVIADLKKAGVPDHNVHAESFVF
ncbi:MAG: ferric reductase-like transmembrane domain-containing protein [Cellulomonadaceae bacterium]|nr:ferric reductase-like transmembrane domain-containing protein [Cellulomonadaceae bacterium]